MATIDNKAFYQRLYTLSMPIMIQSLMLALVAAVHVVRDGVRLGAELDDAEGDTGSGEGVSHAVRADDGVDVVDGPARSLSGKCL